MRINRGKHAGRNLTSPGKKVRPTSGPVRERWIEWLQDEIKGARIIELCAGTGAVGLEALSCGGKYVDFVERDPRAFHSLKANIAALRESDRCRIFKKDAVPFTATLEEGRYDIVLADPPYGSGVVQLLLDTWRERRYAPLFALEHATDHIVPRGDRAVVINDSTLTLYKLGKK